jgi:hypothetical protein
MGLLGPYGLPQFGYGGNVGYGGNLGYGGSVGYGGNDGDKDDWDSRGSGSYGMNQYPGYGSSYGSDLSSILGGFTNPKVAYFYLYSSFKALCYIKFYGRILYYVHISLLVVLGRHYKLSQMFAINVGANNGEASNVYIMLHGCTYPG